ncbi:hypothetical protein EV11_0678 [Prochlorococcus sp. SS52]|nr:hypothetical protein EV04_1347 [Prochlorococcus marinus str. LG]KGG21610.1 hypothetical protein EV08_0699 [Prochlorococcus marinus str. SS2]KGG23048.1 hypothetical protein EV09_1793 [Prochlorococcus marinus str. SS35]KGG33755.1 hypothetical protein EV10_0192 [Prochlorococcus marinus str. SS51]KGG36894.1 hypothetical protein EV11_0678 [Prochlorococcus sp. SS52]
MVSLIRYSWKIKSDKSEKLKKASFKEAFFDQCLPKQLT